MPRGWGNGILIKAQPPRKVFSQCKRIENVALWSIQTNQSLGEVDSFWIPKELQTSIEAWMVPSSLQENQRQWCPLICTRICTVLVHIFKLAHWNLSWTICHVEENLGVLLGNGPSLFPESTFNSIEPAQPPEVAGGDISFRLFVTLAASVLCVFYSELGWQESHVL